MATVRRDIDKLEKSGFLIKTYGGAVLNDVLTQEIVSSNIDDAYIDEKIQIGLISSSLIQDNDTIFLGSGSTCMQIARSIVNVKNLTIVTNSLDIIYELRDRSNINVVSTGGNVQMVNDQLSCYGFVAISSVNGLFIKKSFFSMDAADIEYGYMLKNYQDEAL